jgi:Sel1 repeat/Putative peptidoglycan binding domain
MRSDDKSDDATPVLTGKAPVTDCDRIAASATDPERVTQGVTIGALDGAAGVKACRAALAKYPNTARFEFQLARSLQKTEAFDEAAVLYGKLVEHGYFAALVNYGWLLNNGQGVKQNQQAAVKLYLLAAQQGDLFGMFDVAMAYDSGEGLPFNPAQAAAWIYAALRLGHDYSIKQMSGSAEGWTKPFRVELQRLLKQAGLYQGRLDGVFGPEVWNAVREVQTLPLAPTPGGMVPTKRWDPQSIPVNAPLPQ